MNLKGQPTGAATKRSAAKAGIKTGDVITAVNES